MGEVDNNRSEHQNIPDLSNEIEQGEEQLASPEKKQKKSRFRYRRPYSSGQGPARLTPTFSFSSFRGKMVTLALVVLLLCIALGWVLTYELSKSQKQLVGVNESYLTPTKKLHTLKEFVMSTHLQILDIYPQYNGDSVEFKKALRSNIRRSTKSIEKNQRNFTEELKAYEKEYLENYEQPDIKSLKDEVSEYNLGTILYLSYIRRRYLGDAVILEEEYDFENIHTSVSDLSASALAEPLKNIVKPMYKDIDEKLQGLLDDKLRHAEALSNTSMAPYFTAIALLILLLAALFGFIRGISTSLTESVNQVSNTISALSEGFLNRKTIAVRNDEFKTLNNEVNQLAINLSEIGSFASKIGSGVFDHELLPNSEQDELRIALNNMRDRLNTVATEDQKRTWAITGLAQLSDIFRLSDSLDALTENIISALAKYIHANQGAIYILEEKEGGEGNASKTLKMYSSYAYGADAKGREFLLGEGFVGQAGIEKEVIYISDVPKDYVTMSSGLGQATPKSLLIVPMIFNDNLEGVMEFASFGNFEKYQIDFVTKISDSIAASVGQLKGTERTLRLLAESQSMSNELKAKQKELLENAEIMQSTQQEMENTQVELKGQMLAMNNAAIVSETDLDGNITFVNDEFVTISRYSREELRNQNHRILKSDEMPDDYYVELWETISNSKVWKGQLKNISKAGQHYWVDATITPMLNNQGKPVKYISVQFDITKQKLQEEKISLALEQALAQEEELRQNAEEMEAQSEEMRRTSIELAGQINALNNSAIVSETDLQGRIIKLNDEFIKISKYTREELIGQNHRLLKSGHQEDKIFEDLWKTITEGNVWIGEFKNKSKDGSYYWVSATVTPVLDASMKPVKYIGVTFDVTSQKMQEEQIRAALEISQTQEAELRQNADELTQAQDEMRKTQIELRGQIGALNNAGIVAETDLRGNITLINESFCTLSGYLREELLGQNHRILKSEEHSETEYQNLWDVITGGEVWNGRFKNRAKDGSFYWVQSTITPVLGFDGKPVKYIGVSFDITKQQESEFRIQEALDISQEQQKQLEENANVMEAQQVELAGQIGALNNAGIVSESDLEGNITFMNEAGLKMWGYTEEEIIGQNYRILKSDEHDDDFFKNLWDTVVAGEVWKGELKNKSKHEDEYWNLVSITPVKDNEGNIVKFISVAFDITKQKKQAGRIKKLFDEAKGQEEMLLAGQKEMESVQEKMLETQLELAGQINAINNAAIVSETDLDGVLTFVNPEATFVWGYNKEELIGQNHNILNSGYHPEKFFKRMWEKISSGQLWHGQVQNKAKDGNNFWVELTITPVLDFEDKPMKYIGVAFDITKQKIQSIRIKEALSKVEQEEMAFRVKIESLEKQLSEAALTGTSPEGDSHHLNINDKVIMAEIAEDGKLEFANQLLLTHLSLDSIDGKFVIDVFENWRDATSTDNAITEQGIYATLKLKENTDKMYWCNISTSEKRTFLVGQEMVGDFLPATDTEPLAVEQFEANEKELKKELENLKAENEELQKAKAEAEELKETLETSPKSIDIMAEIEQMHANLLAFELDASGTLLSMNKRMSLGVGYDISDLQGKTLGHIAYEGEKPAFDAMQEELKKNNKWEGTLTLSTRSHGMIMLDISLMPDLDDEGVLSRYIGIGLDNTEYLLALQEKLKEDSVNPELQKKIKELEEAIDKKEKELEEIQAGTEHVNQSNKKKLEQLAGDFNAKLEAKEKEIKELQTQLEKLKKDAPEASVATAKEIEALPLQTQQTEVASSGMPVNYDFEI